MRLIDADKFIEQNIEELSTAIKNTEVTEEIKECFKAGVEACLLNLEIADEVDAEPVRHGHWGILSINRFVLDYGGTAYEPWYTCSCCGRITESYLRNDEPIMPEDADFPEYCPHCGAKMDEEVEFVE